MASRIQVAVVLLTYLVLFVVLVAGGGYGCGESSIRTTGAGGTESAGLGGNGGAVGGNAGSLGTGGTGAALSTGGTGGTVPIPREDEVLLVGGFMSELYETLSRNLEDRLNEALQASARALNVHIELPLDRSIDIAIGDAIASALPRASLPIESGGFVSFYTQEQHFDAAGVAYTNIVDASSSFNTIESVEHNAVAILDYLRQADVERKRVVIVSHSKGGLDTLGALLLPEARELWGQTVVGWVALQTPFRGSPVADPSPSSINAILLEALGGDGQSLDDLKSEVRVDALQRRSADIRDLTSSIPIISAYNTYEASGAAASFVNTFAGNVLDAAIVSQITQIVVNNYWDSPLDIPGVISRSTTSAVNLIRSRVGSALDAAVGTVGLMDVTNIYMNTIAGGSNDGLVPLDSTVLSGAIHRELPAGDHASPVMDVDPLKNFWPSLQRDMLTVNLVEEVRDLAASAE